MTIAELFEALGKFPRDSVVVINDADTNWYLNIKSVELMKGLAVIGGYYGDEVDKDGVPRSGRMI